MNTYLFTWNYQRWNWPTFQSDIRKVKDEGKATIRWSCGNTRSIRPGDEAFLLKLGQEPRGILGSGLCVSEPFSDYHWIDKTKQAYYVNIEFDKLIDYTTSPILTLDTLAKDQLAQQHWVTISSGILIKPVVIEKLHDEWAKYK